MAGGKLDECGITPDGLRVRAITDILGSQVVVTMDSDPGRDSLLSRPLGNHAEAIRLGVEVARRGVLIYLDWQGPIDTVFDLMACWVVREGQEQC